MLNSNKIPYKLASITNFQTTGMTPPNKILFGFDAIKRISDEAKNLTEGKSIVILSDKNLEKIGIVSQIKSLLLSSNFKVEVFSDIEPEPSLKTVEKIYSKYEKNKISLFIGLGGGSVMDVTKLIAQALVQKDSISKYVNKEVVPNKKGLPVILAPTTAGTGSEISSYIVIKDNNKKIFLKNSYFFPALAIIDPFLTVSMPSKVTASTGIDALSHAIEGMMHKDANPLTDSLGIGAIEMISKYLRKAVADGEDLEARYYMSFAATLGMMAMCISGASYAHSVSYVIGKYRHTPHGIGCGLGLPYLMNFNIPVIPNKLSKIANAMGEQTLFLSEWEKAKLSVHSVYQLIKDCGLPVCLKDYGGINKNDLEEMANITYTMYSRPMNPRKMTKEDCINYWQDIWSGKI